MEAKQVSVVTARLLIDFGEHLGLPRADLLEAAGLRGEDLDQRERVPFKAPLRLWAHFLSSRPDEPLGLMLAERLRPKLFGLAGHLMRHSEDLEQLLERLAHYENLIEPSLNFELVDCGEILRLELHHDPRVEELAHPLEAMIGAVVHTVQEWLQQEVALEVWFRHEALHAPDEYADRLGVDVSFGQPANAVLFPSSLLTAHLPLADPAVAEFLSRMADERLEQVTGEPLIRRVEHAIERSVDQIDLTQDEVAAAVGVSVRTMQRRLREASLTYTELVQRIRRATAERLLRETDHPIYQVAEMVGYAEAASFTRAFRQWTGTTPNAFRHRGSG
ncbi:MAG: AraC family transcriptional regulator ligand-binding domain-containing protein [Persicimonas sp.]